MTKKPASKSKTIQNPVQDLFIKEIANIYDAKQKFLKALPEITDSVHTTSLKKVLLEHYNDIKNQISRLDEMFEMLKEKSDQGKSIVMDSHLKEIHLILKNYDLSALKDAELISALQKINHYEIACNEIALTFAKQLGYMNEITLLKQALEEETTIAVKFKTIAEGGFFTKGVVVIASQEVEKAIIPLT